MTETTPLRVEILELDGRDDAAILRLHGEVDMGTVDQMTAGFEILIERGLTNVVVDAQGVSFMDSTGLSGLVTGKERIHRSGSRIVLVASPAVRRILELAFPDHLYADRVDTMKDALAALDT